MRLNDKSAIVTGGAAGIGRAICQLFAEEGASVTVADIDEVGGRETVRLIADAGGEAGFVRTDVSDETQVKAMVDQAASSMGKIDVLVNDAAAFVFGLVEDVTDDDWQRVFGVNVIGASYCVRNVMPHMKALGGGSIVNIASVSAMVAQAAFVPYNASKGALLQLTRCLALDLAPNGIRVNCVCPGSVLTQATEAHRKFTGTDRDDFLREAGSSNFLKRIADPREIAYGALFLASDESSFMTGSPLIMDGGATAQ
ncbi:MAG: glucose 1-dehydrogenase [SAR202 cluster bacterium]|nr:glucose 1-dehydrogenase [SAR202 cluster bacterium]|tara:strand:+ start:129 stop:893 length:765 start_codon:yes stop_codon:yes gene_type:complete